MLRALVWRRERLGRRITGIVQRWWLRDALSTLVRDGGDLVTRPYERIRSDFGCPSSGALTGPSDRIVLFLEHLLTDITGTSTARDASFEFGFHEKATDHFKFIALQAIGT